MKHDATALAALYAPSVQFYGSSLSGRECAERKKAAFAKNPDYAQSIRNVVVDGDAGAGGSATITFTKTSTTQGKSTDFPAIVVVVGGLITAETDQISEANLATQRAAAEMWCVDGSAYGPPNDRVTPPYRISALQAYQRARKSAHFEALVVAEHGDFLDFGQFWCPTKCTRVTTFPDAPACGYNMKLENHSELARRANDPNGFSIWVEWVYVDAVDGTMYWQGGTVEPLPD